MNTFYSARSQLEEERETLKLAEEKLRDALPVGSAEHGSIALEITRDYPNPETLAMSGLRINSDNSPESTSTEAENASMAVLALGDSCPTQTLQYIILIVLLDDGGIRTLTSLYTLKNLLGLVSLELHGERLPLRPCEIFDVIVGSGTGGYAQDLTLHMLVVC